SGDTIDVTEVLDAHVAGETASSCQVLWQGTMLPRFGRPCMDHSDCIEVEGPCSRCVDDFCRVPPPFCRAGPDQPTRLDGHSVNGRTAAPTPRVAQLDGLSAEAIEGCSVRPSNPRLERTGVRPVRSGRAAMDAGRSTAGR